MIPLKSETLENIRRKYSFYGEIFDALPEGSKEKQTITWNIAKNLVLERDSYRCRVCGKSPIRTNWNGSFDKIRLDLEVHHIIPRIAGGTDSTKNLITLCKSCHVKTFKNDYEGLPYYQELNLSSEIEMFTNSGKLIEKGHDCRKLKINSFYFNNDEIECTESIEGLICRYFSLDSVEKIKNDLSLDLDEIVIKNEKGKFCLGLVEYQQSV